MKNLFICKLDKKDVNLFTSDLGLSLRKKADKPFKKLVRFFTNVNIIRMAKDTNLTDEEYFSRLELRPVPHFMYPLSKKYH